MFKAIIAFVEVIIIAAALPILLYLFEDYRAVAKAKAFCDREVIVGKPSADLIEKAHQAGAIPYFNAPNLLKVIFKQSFRPPACVISISNGIIVAKEIDQLD
jgi:hypothetical protein